MIQTWIPGVARRWAAWAPAATVAAVSLAVSSASSSCCRHTMGAGVDIKVLLLQVITKLLYLLHQGETFTKASTHHQQQTAYAFFWASIRPA